MPVVTRQQLRRRQNTHGHDSETEPNVDADSITRADLQWHARQLRHALYRYEETQLRLCAVVVTSNLLLVGAVVARWMHWL
jgi:hypothetical protein